MSRKNKSLINLRHATNESYEVREEQRNGRTYWVVPVVMSVEGVHHGSAGPLLYGAEELAYNYLDWNGVPVTIDHPQDDGQKISANSPGVSHVGTVYNVKIKEGNKLVGEAWLDPVLLEQESPEAYEQVENQRPLEVSIGSFADVEWTGGEWHGEDYEGIIRKQRPDHLALLPEAVGACSYDDGCGIRNNKNEGGNMAKNKDPGQVKKMARQLLTEGYTAQLIDNQTGHREVMMNIQNKLDSMDNEVRVHFLEEVFDDFFVYRIHNRESNESTLFKRDYVVAEDGTVEFEGDPVQVRKDVEFVELMQRMKNNRKNSNISNTKKGGKMPNVKNASPCDVDALIENEATHFTEEDRDWLSDLEEEQLKKLAPKEKEPTTNDGGEGRKDGDQEPAKKQEPVANQKDDSTTSEKVEDKSVEEQVKEVFQKAEKPEEFIQNFFPAELADQMLSGLRIGRETRQKLINEIVSNSKFKKEQLENWKTEDLTTLHASVTENKVDYSVNASSGQRETADELNEDVRNAMLYINQDHYSGNGQNKEGGK